MSNRDSSARGSGGPTEGALELRLRRDAASWRLEPSRGLSQRVLAGIGPAAAPRRRGVVRVLAAAASILLAIGLALYLPPAAPAPTGSEQLSRILPTLTSYLGWTNEPLFQLDGRACILEFLLDGLRLFFGGSFFDRFRSSLYKILGLFKPEAGDLSYSLNHLDFVRADL